MAFIKRRLHTVRKLITGNLFETHAEEAGDDAASADGQESSRGHGGPAKVREGTYEGLTTEAYTSKMQGMLQQKWVAVVQAVKVYRQQELFAEDDSDLSRAQADSLQSAFVDYARCVLNVYGPDGATDGVVKFQFDDHPSGLLPYLALALDSVAVGVMFRGFVSVQTVDTLRAVADLVLRICDDTGWGGIMRVVKAGVMGQLSNLTLVLVDFLLNKSDTLPSGSPSSAPSTPTPSAQPPSSGVPIDAAAASGQPKGGAAPGSTQPPLSEGAAQSASSTDLARAIAVAGGVLARCSRSEGSGRTWCVATPPTAATPNVSHELSIATQALRHAEATKGGDPLGLERELLEGGSGAHPTDTHPARGNPDTLVLDGPTAGESRVDVDAAADANVNSSTSPDDPHGGTAAHTAGTGSSAEGEELQERPTSPVPHLPRRTVLQIVNGWLRSAPGRAPAAVHDAECCAALLGVATGLSPAEVAACNGESPRSVAFWAGECVTAMLLQIGPDTRNKEGNAKDAAGGREGGGEVPGSEGKKGFFPALYGVLEDGGAVTTTLWRSVRLWLEASAERGVQLDSILDGHPLLELCTAQLRAEVEGLESTEAGLQLGRGLARTAGVILCKEHVSLVEGFDYSEYFSTASLVFPGDKLPMLEQLVLAIIVGGHCSLGGLQEPEMHTIVNTAAIKAAVAAVPRLVPPPPEDEEHSPPSVLLRVLKQLCIRNRTNLVVSSRCGLFGDFLELFRSWTEATQRDLEVLLEVIVALGQFEPTRQDAQDMFHDVFHKESVLDSRRRLMLQDAIVAMSSVTGGESSDAPSSIYLNGRGTSIRLPHLRLSSSGYGVHMWFRLESLRPVVTDYNSPAPSDAASIVTLERDAAICTGASSVYSKRKQEVRANLACDPQLIGLSNDQGAGVAVDVVGASLRVRILYTPSSIKTIDCPGVALSNNEWALLSVVHVSKGPLTSAGELRVYWNGELRHKEAAKLPNLKREFLNNAIGKGQTVVRKKRQFDVAMRMEVVSCVVTAPVTDHMVQYIHSLGRDYVGKFEKHAVSTAAADDGGSERELSVGSRVLSFVHAKAVVSMEGAIANLAEGPASAAGPAATGSLIGLVYSPLRISDIALVESGYSICALGIENVEQLTALYDRERGSSKLAGAEAKRRQFIERATTSALSFLSVILLSETSVKTPAEEHRSAIVMSAALLDATSPKVLGVDAIKVIDSLQVNLATAQGVFDTAQIILDEFLMNSRMWLGEGAIDPLAYFKYVVSIAKNRPETCWHTHGIDHCFLLLELSRTVVAEAARDCRRCVITIMNLYSSKGFLTREILRYILSCIRMVSDDNVAHDLSIWLAGHCQRAALQKDPASQKIIAPMIETTDPPVEVYTCLSRPHSGVQAAVLSCAACLCAYGTADNRVAMRLASVGFSGVSDMMGSQSLVVTPAIVDMLLTLATGKQMAQRRVRESLAMAGSDECKPIAGSPARTPEAGGPGWELITSRPQFMSPRAASVSGTPVPKGQAKVELKSPSAFLALFEVVANTVAEDPTELVVYALRTALSALEPIDDVSRLTATAGWQQALLRIAHRVDLDPVADPLSNAQDLNPTPKLLENFFSEGATLLIKTLAAILVRELKGPKAQMSVVEDTIMHLSHEVYVARYTRSGPGHRSSTASARQSTASTGGGADSGEASASGAAAAAAATPEIGSAQTDGSGVSRLFSDGVVDIEEPGRSFPFRAWLLAALLHETGVTLKFSQKFGEVKQAAQHDMLRLVFLAERLLYLDSRSDMDGVGDEADGVARLVLANATLEFTHILGLEYDQAMRISTVEMSSSQLSTGSEDGGGRAAVGGGNPAIARAGGCMRITFRLVIEELLNCSRYPIHTAIATLCAEKAAAWLNRLWLEGGRDQPLMTSVRAKYAIWNMQKRLQGEGDKEDIEVIVQLLRRFLRRWWWSLETPTTVDDDPEVEAVRLSGPEDPRLATEEPIDVMLELIGSAWWQGLMAATVLEAAESYISETHVEVGEDVHLLRERFLQIEHETLASSRLEFETNRRASRTYFKGLEEKVMAELDGRFTARMRRSAALGKKKRIQGLRQWRDVCLYLYCPRGVLQSADLELEYGPQNFTYGEWRIDVTEDFWRRRTKLMPDPDFDRHTMASMRRDNPDVPVEVALATYKPEVTDQWTQKLRDALSTDNDDGKVYSVKDDKAYISENFPDNTFSCEAELVQYMSTIAGFFVTTPEGVHFWTGASQTGHDGLPVDFTIPFDTIREIHTRRYNLRDCAMELFQVDQTNFFLKFKDTPSRNSAFAVLQSAQPPNLIYAEITRGDVLLKKSRLTKRWQQRKLSNFEYLAQLNTLAGRSYSDLHQYPVFPWVIADYTSEKLDFESATTFRDLSKPMGALNPDRLEFLKAMHDGNDDPIMGRFMYGTHYSNAGAVLHYMIRLQPYAALHVEFQNGKFDHCDRLFWSIPQQFSQIAAGSAGDVKELTPEWFFLPEMFENASRFDLGVMQNGITVDDVVLPPWAKDARDFVRKNREALESEFVSANLHLWIDLIFGYKQRGEAAVEAYNCFLPSSYEGTFDLDAIADPVERNQREAMIRELGQTPSQLLTKPHPSRNALGSGTGGSHSKSKALGGDEDAGTPSSPGRGELVEEGKDHGAGGWRAETWSCDKAYFVEATGHADVGVAVVLVPYVNTAMAEWMRQGLATPLVTISEMGTVAVHNWLPTTPGHGKPFTLDVDTRRNAPFTFTDGVYQHGCPLQQNTVASTRKNDLMLVAGALDHTIKLYRVGASLSCRTRAVSESSAMNAVSTCLCLDSDGETVAVGYQNGMCALFTLKTYSRKSKALEAEFSEYEEHGGAASWLHGPTSITYGHCSGVTSIATQIALDVVVSGSAGGFVNVARMRSGKLVYVLRPPPPASIAAADPCEITSSVCNVLVSPSGIISIYCAWRHQKRRYGVLYSYSINGKLLASDENCGTVSSVILSSSGNTLVVCKRRGFVGLRDPESLKVRSKSSTNSIPILTAQLTSNDSHLLLGLADGKLIVLPTSSAADAAP